MKFKLLQINNGTMPTLQDMRKKSQQWFLSSNELGFYIKLMCIIDQNYCYHSCICKLFFLKKLSYSSW